MRKAFRYTGEPQEELNKARYFVYRDLVVHVDVIITMMDEMGYRPSYRLVNGENRLIYDTDELTTAQRDELYWNIQRLAIRGE